MTLCYSVSLSHIVSYLLFGGLIAKCVVFVVLVLPFTIHYMRFNDFMFFQKVTIFSILLLLIGVCGYRKSQNLNGKSDDSASHYNKRMAQYDRLDVLGQSESLRLEGSEETDSRSDFRHGFAGEYFYESLHEPFRDSEVLIQIQKPNLPIPSIEMTSKDSQDNMEDLVQVEDAPAEVEAISEFSVKDRFFSKVAEESFPHFESRPPRSAGRLERRCYRPISRATSFVTCQGSTAKMEPKMFFDECRRTPTYDTSWMTCDARIQDWSYKNPLHRSGRKNVWKGEIHQSPSVSFKQIIQDFVRDRTGAGFLAMYHEIRADYDSKVRKRNVCSKRQIESAISSKWESLRDKVLEVRRDIRKRMIRKAEIGELSKPGMIFLRDEELLSDALRVDGSSI